MRIFMTGATGVVGRRAIPLLLLAGHTVTALARSADKQRLLQRQGVTAILGTLDDTNVLRAQVAGHDVLINLATHIPASATRMLFRKSWRENDHVRRDGSHALANAVLATGVARFIQESFAPIYEDGGDNWITEASPVRPVPYNESVLDAEQSALLVSNAGRTGVVLRFGAFYGPDSRLLHEMFNVMRKGWAPYPGAPTAYLSSITHDDAATAVVAALKAPMGVYNVCDNEPMRRGEWNAAIASALGIAVPRPLPRFLTSLGGSGFELLSRSQRISNAKIRAATGWAPQYPSVREGAAYAIGG